MDGRQKSIDRIVADVLELDEGEARGAYLDVVCAGDDDLRALVEARLRELAAHPTRVESEAQTADTPARPPLAHWHFEGDTGERQRLIELEAPSLVGRTIGRYHVKRVIASGGMGKVYEAVQESPRRTVALKVVKSGIASRSALRRFEYESQILARLRHPGIAQVYEAGTHDDGSNAVPYFAMEYIPNARPITQYARDKALSARERLRLFALVCDAVYHGHQKGIIHRDLKPSNILVDPTGQPKVIDFGVARATDSDLVITTLQTDVGQLIGTLQYMSPEQCDADPHDIDTRSDVYALGVVLYELLTAQLPYDLSKAAVYEAARVIRESSPPRPSSFNRTLRGDVETIALKALEKDRERRYRSAADLAADIQHYLNDEPIIARPPSLVYQVRKFTRRNKALVGGMCATFAALLLGLAGTIAFAVRAEDRRLAAEAAVGRAQHAEARAEHRFRQVRQLANRCLVDFYDAIKDLAGATPARQLLVRTAAEYLDALRQDAGDDYTLRREVAEGYAMLGSILGNPFSAGGHLGDSEGAATAYTKALELLESIPEPNRSSPEVRRGLADVNASLADLLAFRGNSGEALRGYENAIANLGTLAASGPDQSGDLQRLAIVYNKRGYCLQQTGRPDDALASYVESLGCFRAIGVRTPDNEEWRRGMAVNLSLIGETLLQQARASEAVANLAEAVDHFSAIAQANPDNAFARVDLATATAMYADALKQKGEIEAAAFHAANALKLREELLAADKQNAELRRAVAVSHQQIGNLKLEQGDPSAALTDYITSLADFRAAASGMSADARVTEDTAIACSKVAHALRDMGHLDDATGSFQEAAELLAGLIRADPMNLQTRDELVEILGYYASTAAGAGRLSEAEDTLLESYETARTVFGPSEACTSGIASILVDLYSKWHATEPDKGYDAKAAEWRTRLAEIESATVTGENAEDHETSLKNGG